MVLLNLLLVAVVVSLGWTLRERWRDAEGRQRDFLTQVVKAAQVQQLAPPAPIDKAVPADYIDVAQRTLFSKDRNPNVAIEPPPAPPPPPPVPAFPIYHGQMNFGDPVVILSTTGSDQRSYHSGEAVGKFKLVAFTQETITLEFDGKNLEKRLTDLAPPKDAPPPVPQPASSSVSTVAPAAVTSLAGGGTNLSHANDTPALGVDMGGFHACVPGDNSPAGTILNGFKKVITQGLMGQSCHWEPVSNR
jgi:hypothetical protein